MEAFLCYLSREALPLPEPTMDAQHTPPYVQACESERCTALRKEEAMNSEQLPLPVAMRADELTEDDFKVLYERAKAMQAEKPEPIPRKIPMGKRVAAPA